MIRENTTPLISKTAFSCPHCGAYAMQHWYQLIANSYSEEQRKPIIPTVDTVENIRVATDMSKETKDELLEWGSKMLSGKPYFEIHKNSFSGRLLVMNCNFSKCYNCEEIAIWVHDQIVYPNVKIDILPNNDLPVQIRSLFEEAREIVNSSPKGAAALLRLCVQYLCKELGESGKNIDKDIASLVSKGLNPLVQQALDIVRVIGNESVHPGEIDLNDNKEVAVKLFSLVNLICEQMISLPKQVQELYGSLPEGKRESIEKRNAKAKGDE